MRRESQLESRPGGTAEQRAAAWPRGSRVLVGAQYFPNPTAKTAVGFLILNLNRTLNLNPPLQFGSGSGGAD